MREERVKSGIPGFDKLIEGGFPKGFCYSLIGGPGSGKTIFGVQFIYYGATKYDENGVYVSLEEPIYSVANTAMRFGWNLYDLEDAGRVALLDASPMMDVRRIKYVIRTKLGTEEFSVDSLIGAIMDAKRRVDAKRCVIDSVTSLMLKYRDRFEMRQQMLRLIRALTDERITTLLISEAFEERAEGSRFSALEFLSHGSIFLHTYRVGDSLIRALEVRKMRGTRVVNKICLYTIEEGGIVVRPEEIIFRQNH